MPTLQATPALTSSVELTRVVRSPRSRVYEQWTNAELLQQWFGPANMRCTAVTLDAHLGGAYSIAVRPEGAPATQPDSVATGNYTAVVPGERLQFSWKPSWNPREESLVTISLQDAARGGTEITLGHKNFAPDATEGYTRGWTACLDKLASIAV